jgi:C-terminal processing protease CtpA/Prc
MKVYPSYSFDVAGRHASLRLSREELMRQITRRNVFTGAAAATAATVLTPISGIRPAIAFAPCPTTSVKEFLAHAQDQQLNLDDRIQLIEQAIKLLNGFYAHLPLKRAMYGVDPLERLRLLRQRLRQVGGGVQFHAEMRDIFASLRDMHTVYYLPEPYASAHAWLPFKVEACVEDGRRKYIVSNIVDGFVDATFGRGVEILSVDGIPVERAAELAGRHGSNPAAQLALGLARLSYRALLWEPPPQEDSVLIHYKAGGQELEISIPWSISTLPPGTCDIDTPVCTEVEQLQKFRKFLYAPYENCTAFGDPKRIPTPDGVFGYIRIFSFEKDLLGDETFVDTFKGLVSGLADTKGLIVDVRDNGGGSTRASERIIQFVTPQRPIAPSRLYFVATPETLKFCRLPPALDPNKPSVTTLGPGGLEDWVESIQKALQNGGMFSDALQYTSDGDCNKSPPFSFPGPVIVVTSALSYSSAEFFAAGFQDHGGMILGVDETTGGGGAGYRMHQELHDYFVDAGKAADSPFQPLNQGGFSVAFRRSVRVGSGAGKEIEDLGVYRNRPYVMTRRDLLDHNSDLKREAARLLAQMT